MTGFDALLLDMDGTLVDSNAAVERAWTTWADELGLNAADVLLVAHGSPAEITVRAMLPDLADAEVASLAARQLSLQYDDLDDVIALPGVHELLHHLIEHDVPWAVVTSADVPLATARLAAAGISPPVLVTSDDIVNGKPDPEAFVRAAQVLGVPIERCLVVEDSAPGVVAGRAAGAVVAALNGHDGDIPIDDLRHLLAILSS